ncbi:macrolide family glycosyltransferase [Streptomyces sp. NPDC017979]|uniref:macrolide family glycosyltransferase n=1 Tax=Streptomyces sp. NPDC017979 TaxID=3365024 RepID=UPI0037AAA4DC
MSKHLLFVAFSGFGSVNPTLPLVEELVHRGHRVDYATGVEYSTAVTRAGARWVELPSYELFVPQQNPGPDSVVAWMRHQFAAMRGIFPLLLEYCRAERPDAICYEALHWPGRVVAELLGLPAVRGVPHFASNDSYALFGSMLDEVGPRHPGLMELHAACLDFSVEHGVTVTPAGTLDQVDELNLVFIPREFQPQGESFDGSFHFVGPSVGSRERTTSWEPPVPGTPLLYLSLGTVLTGRPEFYRAVVDAFADGPWHVAVTVGGLDPDEIDPLPRNVEVRAQFPQPAVLRHAAVFASHAGMNSVMEALYYGVPLVTLPYTPEQVANAARVEGLGLGRRLDPGTVTADSLHAAVARVAADGALHARLSRMREVVRGCGGARRSAEVIEEVLAVRPAGVAPQGRVRGVPQAARG